MKVLLDTNILLDVVEKREPHFSASFQVFMKSAKKEIEAIIGASSITDIYYITRRNCKNAEQAMGSIIDMLKIVTPVDTKATDIQEAIKLNFYDFEDGVVAATAARENADYLITRNTNDFTKSPVPAISPADFLKYCESR
ncbi:MAG: PIN domain-containing protein [Treponema sp.]|jgi:predicted nucleic acid-binding protein|nr:PIN domain-containing protein [Treponema sp.]